MEAKTHSRAHMDKIINKIKRINKRVKRKIEKKLVVVYSPGVSVIKASIPESLSLSQFEPKKRNLFTHMTLSHT